MIRLFCGEYMKQPVALHMMLNPCSYGCYYCFAKLGNIKGMDCDAIYREFKKLGEGDPGKSITKYLFQKGHAICISNTTDPFAASNADGFRDLSQWMTEKGISFTLQTRGGKHYGEVIKKIKPTMIYFSVTSDDDEILKTREPGTPSFEERMEFLKQAKQAGHFIVVGLNPYMPHWWKDIKAFASRLSEMGIEHIWIENMHLSATQAAAIPLGLKKKYQDEITNARAKNSIDRPKYRALARYLDIIGFNVFGENRSSKLHFWDDYFKLGYPFMPTLDGFVSHAMEISKGDPIRFTLNYFHEWANVFNDFESSQFHEYVCSFVRTIRKDSVDEKTIRTSKKVHELFSHILDYPSPMRSDDMVYSFTNIEAGKEEIEVDEAGHHVLAVAIGEPEIFIESTSCDILK